MNAQRAERQRFAALSVDQENFGVQDHAVAAGERLRDEVSEMCHLEYGTKKYNKSSDRLSERCSNLMDVIIYIFIF